MTNLFNSSLLFRTFRWIRSLPNFVLASTIKVQLRISWQLKKYRTRQITQPDVVVSLTSYPVRFPGLYWTLLSLLRQSEIPFSIVLWIAHEDVCQIPGRIMKLRNFGLEVKETKDIRAFKKIIPTLHRYPDKVIVTADDDVYYPRGWLRNLVAARADAQGHVIFYRGHRVTFGANGELQPYNKWEHEVTEVRDGDIVFPTGVGGILYPPGALPPFVVNEDLFLSLCPSGDDIWLFWAARANGTKFLKTRPSFKLTNWPGTQRHSLAKLNVDQAANDIMIKNVVEFFSDPLSRAQS